MFHYNMTRITDTLQEQEHAKWYICISSNTTRILGGIFTNTKTQLHVSAINVGHLQVVHEAPYDKVLHVQPEDGQH